MTNTLRIILIASSFIAFLLCVMKIKQSKLKVENAVTWMFGSIILILMSIFSNVVEWISNLLGFVSPVNFVFLIMIFIAINGPMKQRKEPKKSHNKIVVPFSVNDRP